MDPEWLKKVPNFLDKDEWMEDVLLDFYIDVATGLIGYCNYGTALKELVVGMVIKKRNAKDSKLWLMEYRGKKGEGPFVLQWGADGEKVSGMAGATGDKKWRIKSENETFVWRIGYDFTKRQVQFAIPRFEPIKRNFKN